MANYDRSACNAMEIAQSSSISHGRYVSRGKDIHLKINGSNSSLYQGDNYWRFTRVSEKSPYNEEQNRTHKHYGKATGTTQRSYVNDTAAKEEGPPLNIQITSAFSLSPNMSSSSIHDKRSNYPQPTPFYSGSSGSQSFSRNLTCPILWQQHAPIENKLPKHGHLQKDSLANQHSRVGEDAIDSRLLDDQLKRRQQIYTKTAQCGKIVRDSQKVWNKTSVANEDDTQSLENLYSKGPPNHRHISHEKGGPSSSLALDRYTDTHGTVMTSRKDVFETKRGALDGHQEQCFCICDYSKSQRIELDESIPVDLNTNEMHSSPCIASGEHCLPIVMNSHDNSDNNKQLNTNAQRRLVTYTGKIRLPWRLQNLSEESFHKFKMTNREQVKQNDVQSGLPWGFTRQNNKHVPIKANGKGVHGLKKRNPHNSRKSKLKYENAQFFVTPAPETFKNFEMQLALENDEEPVVKIPNYFLDFTPENRPNYPSTLELFSTSKEIVSVGSLDLDLQSHQVYSPCHKPNSKSVRSVVKKDDTYKMTTTLKNTMPREIATKSIKAFDVDKHFTKGQGALNFHEKTPQVRTFQVCTSKDERPESPIKNSLNGVLCPRATIKRPEGNTSAPTSPDEYQGMYPFHEVPLTKPDRRIDDVSIHVAHNSLKSILDFSGPFQSNDKITKQHVSNAAFERKDTFAFTEDEFPLSSSRNHQIMNDQESGTSKKTHILPELGSSKATNRKVGQEFLLRSETHAWNGISNHEIRSTYTQTSVVENSPIEVSLGERKYQCEVCGRAFSRSNTLATHKRIHTGDRPFPCDLCGRAFRQLGNLTRHKLTHAAIKPHACPKCNKCFSRTSNLNTHMRTHTNYKPFVCDFCGKGFHQKVDMKIHRYTHTGEKPHRCSKCGRGFKQLTHLKYHMRTHSAVRMYTCEHCGKGFNQKGNLQAHIYGHTGNRPYKCDICGKGFTLTSTLNTHKRTHAPNKPFKCEFCEKAFYQKNALKTHYISSHPYTDGVCLL